MFSYKKGLLFLVLALMALTVAACGSSTSDTLENTAVRQPSKNSAGYTDINVEQLEDMLEEKDFAFINVHIPYAGDIPQTDFSIPFDQIEANVSQLPTDKDAPLVIYCRSGNMSTEAAETLVALGYNNVMEVDGGMNAWQAAGNELVNNQ